MAGASVQRPWFERLFDIFCVVSIAGIYPRYIEPNLICTFRHSLSLPHLPTSLDGMKVLLFSDLHINQYSSPYFLNRLRKKILSLSPDFIVFAGDVCTYASIPRPDLAAAFFNNLTATFGVFACLGNHDYSSYPSDDRIRDTPHPITQGLSRLLGGQTRSAYNSSPNAIPLNQELLQLYSDNNIAVLHNETVHVGIGSHRINLTGLGDLSTGHFLPSLAYKGYDPKAPGIVVGHSPDLYSFLSYFPGDLFCFGHTHGGQINLPFFWEKLTPLRDKTLKSGLHKRNGRSIFVTRGVGATFPFRLFSPPQIVLFTLYRRGPIQATVPATSILESLSSMPSYATTRNASQEDSSL